MMSLSKVRLYIYLFWLSAFRVWLVCYKTSGVNNSFLPAYYFFGLITGFVTGICLDSIEQRESHENIVQYCVKFITNFNQLIRFRDSF